MPHLNDLAANTSSSTIVFGAPFSGKTTLVCEQLAKHYKVILVDFEKGRTALAKLDPKLLDNIDVIPIFDTKKDVNAIGAALKLVSGSKRNFCNIHQKIDCTCSRSRDPEVQAQQYSYEFNSLDPNEYVVVFDSLSQIDSSAKAHISGSDKVDEAVSLSKLTSEKFDFDQWAALGTLLERFLDMCQNSRFHVVVIAHESGVELEDGTEKLIPLAGTQKFARKVGKYFDNVVYCSVKNRKHKAVSVTTDNSRILSGSRNGVEVSVEDTDSMARLLGKKGLPEPTNVTTTKSSNAKSSNAKTSGTKSSLLSRK